MSTGPQEKGENFWENSLKLMKQCPLCGLDYTENSYQTIDQNEESRLIHMTCPHCAHCVLAFVLQSRLGLSSIGIMTDLTAADVIRFQNREPISENEILSLHNLLENRTQEMSHLFV